MAIYIYTYTHTHLLPNYIVHGKDTQRAASRPVVYRWLGMRRIPDMIHDDNFGLFFSFLFVQWIRQWTVAVVDRQAVWSCKRPGITATTRRRARPLQQPPAALNRRPFLANFINFNSFNNNSNRLRRRRQQRQLLRCLPSLPGPSFAESSANNPEPPCPDWPLLTTAPTPFWVWSICTASFSRVIRPCVRLDLPITSSNNNSNNLDPTTITT